MGCCRKLACTGCKETEIEEHHEDDIVASEVVIDKDVKTNNAMVPGATEMEVELDDECSFSDQEIFTYEHDGGVGYRSFTLNENSHDLEDEESDENDELQFSLESLEMMVLSDQDKVVVDATQVIERCDGKKEC